MPLISGIQHFICLTLTPLCRGGAVWSGGRAVGSGEAVIENASRGFLTRRPFRTSVCSAADSRCHSRGPQTAQTQAAKISIPIPISVCRPCTFFIVY